MSDENKCDPGEIDPERLRQGMRPIFEEMLKRYQNLPPAVNWILGPPVSVTRRMVDGIYIEVELPNAFTSDSEVDYSNITREVSQ